SRKTSCPGDVLGGSVLDQETSRVSAAVAGTEGLSPAGQSRNATSASAKLSPQKTPRERTSQQRKPHTIDEPGFFPQEAKRPSSLSSDPSILRQTLHTPTNTRRVLSR